jgi:predicted enzyme related to lactoylglutathione lyase
VRVAAEERESGVFRPAGISYLRVPAVDPKRAVAFYEVVFGWRVDADREDPSFEDGSGHVIGHIEADMEVAGEAGIRPYVYVESVETALEKIVSNGGEVVTPPYPEGDLSVAVFRDPEGNVLGIWQRS